MARYIDADVLKERIEKLKVIHDDLFGMGINRGIERVETTIEMLPVADVVETEKYNDLREAFVDFVCSGVHNPAPYCKNNCDECVDGRGFCTYAACNGFDPDERYKTQ